MIRSYRDYALGVVMAVLLVGSCLGDTWLPNSVAWMATVAGAFRINLALLSLVTGRP